MAQVEDDLKNDDNKSDLNVILNELSRKCVTIFIDEGIYHAIH